LVSSSDIALSNNQGSSLLNEIERSNDAASSIIYKRQITGLAPTPVKKDESSKVNVEKAVSDIQQKQAETPASTTSQANSGARAARMTSGEITTKTSEYANLIKLRVRKNWSLPPELQSRKDLENIVEIKIMRDGSLAYAGFEKRSGNSYYDDSTMKAVKKSAPFPPLFEEFPYNSMEIGIIFNPSQLH
jgi:TonB family protein